MLWKRMIRKQLSIPAKNLCNKRAFYVSNHPKYIAKYQQVFSRLKLILCERQKVGS